MARKCYEKRKNGQHLLWNDRLTIERLLRRNKSKAEIAVAVGCSERTVYREVRRGLYTHLNSDLTTCQRYSPAIAQQKYDELLAAKGPPIKLGNDFAFAEYVETKIVKEKHSPYAALAQIKRENKQFKTSVSVRTLYNYIDKGVFLNLTNKNLPEKGKRKGQYKRIKRIAARPPAGTSIEQRPRHIAERYDIGHWEMDTVIGYRSGKNQAALVLSERVTRAELIRPLKSRSAVDVVSALDKLKRKYKNFPKIFQSITVDNGSEFSDVYGMERSRNKKTKRTNLYYCHPYSAWERGTNENINRMIRRFVPKGTNFAKIKPSEWRYIEHWLNNYPRRILGGLAPADFHPLE